MAGSSGMRDSGPMEPTGERTVPGIDREQYFFARHLAVYSWIRDAHLTAHARVVDAGSGEGYGAALLRESGAEVVVGLEYDDGACRHASSTYRSVSMVRANLADLPLRPRTIDLLVCLQVVEHLWDLPGFLSNVRAAVRPGGLLIASTPHRETFSPGLGRGEKPLNPFHVEEFDAEQIRDLVIDAGWVDVDVLGLHHGERITTWESAHGSVMQAQVRAMVTDDWPTDLESFIRSVTDDDFPIRSCTQGAQDLIVIGRCP